MATRATAAGAPSKRFVRVAAVLGLNVLTLGASFTATGTAVDALTSVGVIADATSDRPPRMAITSDRSPGAGRFTAITSPDVGELCAVGLDAVEITEFFSRPVGSFQGADYQRSFRLADDRVLWTFQDAFIAGTLVHNVGMIQSGRCFTILNSGARSWLLGDSTSHMRQWHWVLDGGISPDGLAVNLFVVQMNEYGGSYLNRVGPTALRRVVLDAPTLDIVDVIDEEVTGADLYGWSVTSDDSYTYLYSHCYQQFGHDTLLGFGECAVDVKLARVPRGVFEAERKYWDGVGWTLDHSGAVPVVDESFAASVNNPAQIRFDGRRFLLVEKEGDWWGTTVEFGVADSPQGPFTRANPVAEPLKCPSRCNTYFAAWVPWKDSDGRYIWSIGHNRWNGSETHSNLAVYRPTFLTIDL